MEEDNSINAEETAEVIKLLCSNSTKIIDEEYNGVFPTSFDVIYENAKVNNISLTKFIPFNINDYIIYMLFVEGRLFHIFGIEEQNSGRMGNFDQWNNDNDYPQDHLTLDEIKQFETLLISNYVNKELENT